MENGQKRVEGSRMRLMSESTAKKSWKKLDLALAVKLHEQVAARNVLTAVVVNTDEAKKVVMAKGDICRITLLKGPQDVSLAAWNRHNPEERFSGTKTNAELGKSNVTIGDALLSDEPFDRPLAFVIADSQFQPDETVGAGAHITCECDDGRRNKTTAMVTLAKAAANPDLGILANVDSLQLFNDAEKADFFEFIADIDLTLVVAAGSKTKAGGGGDGQSSATVDDGQPAKVEIVNVDNELLQLKYI